MPSLVGPDPLSFQGLAAWNRLKYVPLAERDVGFAIVRCASVYLATGLVATPHPARQAGRTRVQARQLTIGETN